MAGERILIVDDGKENREFIVEYVLQPNGFEPLVARDGLEGLEMARQYRPDLILLDLQMPRMDGMQVLDALNAEQLDIPVILMTFHGSEEIAIEVYRRGVKDYVKKPYTVEEMYDAIDRSMSEVRLRREKDQLTERLIKANAELNQRVRELNVLYGIGKSVTQLMDIEQLMSKVSEAAARLTSCEESSVFLLEPGGELRLKAVSRQADQRTYTVDEVRHDELAMRAVQTHDMVVLTEEESAALRRNNPSAPSTAIAVALMIADNPVGALVVKNFSPGSRMFTRNEGALLSALSDYAAIAIENARHHHKALNQPEPSEVVQFALHRKVVTSVMNQAMIDPDMALSGGKRCEISVLSVELRGHLGFARKAPPEQIVSLLNDYMALATGIMFENEGTLDQLTSDSMTIVFNTPTEQTDHLMRAAMTAHDIQMAVADKNEKQGGGLQFAFGLHVGDAVVGYFGIERSMNYTAVGETVSLAHRLQQMARPGQILVSGAVANALGEMAELEPASDAGAGSDPVFQLTGLRSIPSH